MGAILDLKSLMHAYVYVCATTQMVWFLIQCNNIPRTRVESETNKVKYSKGHENIYSIKIIHARLHTRYNKAEHYITLSPGYMDQRGSFQNNIDLSIFWH